MSVNLIRLLNFNAAQSILRELLGNSGARITTINANGVPDTVAAVIRAAMLATTTTIERKT